MCAQDHEWRSKRGQVLPGACAMAFTAGGDRSVASFKCCARRCQQMRVSESVSVCVSECERVIEWDLRREKGREI